MTTNRCPKCKEMIKTDKAKRHSDLERSGLHKSDGHHGSRDDQYNYTCKVCGTTFVGDSSATWLAEL